MRLAELADHLGAELIGDPEAQVRAVRALDEAGPEDLAFMRDSRFAAQARASRAGAILVSDPGLLPARNLLVSPQPQLALVRAVELLHPADRPIPGVHPSAVVAEDANLGDGVSIGPCAVVGQRGLVGPRTVVGAGCVLGDDVVVGADCTLHPRVVVQHGCRIGDRCTLHPGVVVGSDGFGYATAEGVHHKIPHVGIVVLEDEVELGANTCVDRATLGETRIGRGTKVDNLVQIAHNVTVGEASIVTAQVGLAGSASLGRYVVMGGQSGVSDHVRVGDRAQIAGRAAVFRKVPEGELYAGVPARPYREWMRAQASVARLGLLKDRVAELAGRVAELERVVRAAGDGS